MTDPSPYNRELEPRVVEELAVLDLDRTLINTSKITELVFSFLAKSGVETDRIHEAMTYVEAQSGNSFFLFDYIEAEFSNELLEAVKDAIINDDARLDELRQDLLCPGADRLIYALESQETPWVIVTYGEKNYQKFKIALFSKLIGREPEDVPSIITDTKNKSEWAVEQWFSDDTEFGEVPAGVTGEQLLIRTVTIVDDKTSNLQSLDARVVGVLVDNNVNAAPGVISTAELADAAEAGIHLAEIAQVYEERSEKAMQSNVYPINTTHLYENGEFDELAS